MATVKTITSPAAQTESQPIGGYGNKSSIASSSMTEKDRVWLKNLGLNVADPESFQKAWATDAERLKKPSWRETYGGRVAIRTFSRGIMGASFFAMGQMIESAAFKNYSHDYFQKTSWRGLADFSTPGQYIPTLVRFAAKTLDTTLGKAIYKTTHLITGDPIQARRAVTFRDTRQYGAYNTLKKDVWGRSFGHESLAITFDFGMASLGDYAGREIANLFDPNIKKTWLDDGKINMRKAIGSLGQHTWTALSRAMGEDYFAMLFGYPYVVRFSRNMLNRFSPGFKFDSDYALNGGSVKVDDTAKIMGNYQLEGMTDLSFRFTIYNWYTKMYRDFDDWARDKFTRKMKGENDIGILNEVINGIVHFPGYFIRTAIKMTAIMVPSTFFFFITRSPQSKDVGLAIHPEKGVIGGKLTGDGLWHAFHANGAIKGRRSGTENIEKIPGTQKSFIQFQKNFKNDINAPIKDEPFKILRNGYERRYDAYSIANNRPDIYTSALQGRNSLEWHDRITNPIGKLCYSTSNLLTEALKPAARLIRGNVNSGRVADFSRRAAYASLSYTPYFAMKSDILTAAWDTPRMDMAIDRALHGIAHLKPGEFAAGCSETWRSFVGRPFAEIDRERLAQRKMHVYQNQLWGEPEEIEASFEAEKKIAAHHHPTFIEREALKKKPMTQLASHAPKSSPIKPREASYREELSKNLSEMQVMGHA